MAVTKRRRREKPTKIEQRKVWGMEWGPQVKQTALLPSPIYIGQDGGEKAYKKRSQNWARDFSSHLLGRLALMPQGYIFLYLPIKLSYNTGLSVTSDFCYGRTEPRKLHTPLTYMVLFLGLTWLKQPRLGPCKVEAKHSRSPTWWSPCGRSWTQRKPCTVEGKRSPACWKPGQQKQTQQKAYAAQSQIPGDLLFR